ncbi:MAG TPA: ribosome-associated translation inhibitor RaiA [Verrucomicrobiota bacterium]|nr:ribosome-associated translation inhibitor RaiA [Verrucomicrobiota bacterium]HNT13915.1 ribosome-associated translation inhibitor RaiA [Verrucomicrobiota bacterium]
MKLIIIPHNVTLTAAIEKHVVAKIEKLEHFARRIIDARVTLEHDHTRAPAKQFGCSVRIGVRGPDLFAQDRQADLYAAINLAVKKIEGQFRKRQGKVKTRHHIQASKSKQKLKERGL